MKAISKSARALMTFLTAGSAMLGAFVACTGDDDVYRPTDNGGLDATTGVDSQAADTGGGDAGPTAVCGDAAGAPQRALLVQGLTKTSELAAVNLTTGAVDGRMSFESSYGVTWSAATNPYLLAQETDIVTRLDAREPWKADGTWNVRGNDAVDGGPENANPAAIVVPACGKAYVLRYNRNRIAIIDTTKPGSAPTGYIDLAPYLHAEDADKSVEMTAAVYVASKKRVYVLVGNADLTRFKTIGFNTYLYCSNARPLVVAIDVDTDQLVSLGGTGPNGALVLDGYNPPLGSPFHYDAAFDRFLILHAGCNLELGDGGVGAITKRRVEELSLATGQTKVLLSLDDQPFPSSMAFQDATHAAIGFYGSAFFWDPSKTALGAAIPGGAMDGVLAADGKGNIIGPRSTFLGDGGTGPLELVRASFGDGGSSVVMQNPFSKPGGYVPSIEAWPR